MKFPKSAFVPVALFVASSLLTFACVARTADMEGGDLYFCNCMCDICTTGESPSACAGSVTAATVNANTCANTPEFAQTECSSLTCPQEAVRMYGPIYDITTGAISCAPDPFVTIDPNTPGACIPAPGEPTGALTLGLSSLTSSRVTFGDGSVLLRVTRMGATGTGFAEGEIFVELPSCAGPPNCEVEFQLLRATNEAAFNVDGRTVDDVTAVNVGSFTADVIGSVGDTVMFAAPANTAEFLGIGFVNGDAKGGTFDNSDQITGDFNLTTGTFFINATNLAGPGSVFLDIVGNGTIVARPPIASAGPDQIVSCNLGDGTGLVSLDGTASFDPDGMSLQDWAWVELVLPFTVTPLGSGAVLDIPLAVGTHDLALVAIDSDGHVGFDELVVTVVDDLLPQVNAVTVSPSCIFPGNHKLVRYELGVDVVVDAVGTCDTAQALDYRIVDVVSNQLDDAVGTGDGSTTNDVRFGADGFCIRAERNGVGGADRIYTVTLEVDSPTGATALTMVDISVAHDQGVGTDDCAILPPEVLLDDADPACSFPTATASTGKGKTPVAPGSSGSGCSIAGTSMPGPSLMLLVLLTGAVLLLRRRPYPKSVR